MTGPFGRPAVLALALAAVVGGGAIACAAPPESLDLPVAAPDASAPIPR